MAEVRPVRLQLSRKKGFNLQALSLATNGLPAVKVDRSTPWGNPFVVGTKTPYGSVVADKRHSARLYQAFAPINERLIAIAQKELRGKNLACWCERAPYEGWLCHAHTLLKIANAPICEPVPAPQDQMERAS